MGGHCGRDRRNVRLSDGERRLRTTIVSASADLHGPKRKQNTLSCIHWFLAHAFDGEGRDQSIGLES